MSLGKHTVRLIPSHAESDRKHFQIWQWHPEYSDTSLIPSDCTFDFTTRQIIFFLLHPFRCTCMHFRLHKFFKKVLFRCWFLFLCLFYHQFSNLIIIQWNRKLSWHLAVHALKCRCGKELNGVVDDQISCSFTKFNCTHVDCNCNCSTWKSILMPPPLGEGLPCSNCKELGDCSIFLSNSSTSLYISTCFLFVCCFKLLTLVVHAYFDLYPALNHDAFFHIFHQCCCGKRSASFRR